MVDLIQEPELTEFDDPAIADAVADVTGDGLRTLVEYDEETYNALYVRDDVVAEHGGREDFA